jgi:N-acetylmuramoyl-L-alanine amidase
LKKYSNKNIIFFFCFFLILFYANACFALQNQVKKISTSIKSNQIQLRFELEKSTQYKVFTISNPERLVVDLKDSTLTADIKNFTDPLFSSIRNNFNNQNQLRIVFDLKDSVQIKNSSLTKGKNNKYYLVVNLLSKTSATANNTAKNKNTSSPNEDKIIKLLDKETGTVKYVVKIPKSLPIIVIDSGHGGKDPGTIGKYARSKEKYVTLGYSRELKRQLDKTKKFKVFLTRNTDYFIPLNERVAISRRLKADLFISFHADSSPDHNTSGLSIYSLSEKSSDKQAELLAQKENKSDIIGGADFSDASGDILKTLINLSQRNTMNDSAKFAEIAIEAIRNNGVETLQKTHRFAGFKVLTAPDVPSVLIELGYLSNKDEEKKLNSLTYKKKVAEALVSGIEKYFNQQQSDLN